MIPRSVRLTITGLLAAGLALTAAVWPSRPPGATAASAGPGSTSGTPRPAERGAALFLAKGCATCHDGPTSTAAVGVGPNLALLSEVAPTRVAGLDPEAYARQSIRTPQAFVVPGFTTVLMPTLAVDDQELDALVQYLLG